MPPRKLTQEEKARIRQEELERKAQEEEETRAREEQEQKLQQERDRVEREEREKELLEESARFSVERSELSEFLDKRDQSHSDTLQEQRDRYQWERYTRCPLTPDPFSLRDINTYLTLWREEPAPTSFEALEQKLAEASLFMKELTALQDLGLAPTPNSRPDSGVNFRSVLEEIQEILTGRIDSTTLQLLRQPAGYIDELYGNLKTEARLSSCEDAVLTVSLWGNVASNHRMTHVEFKERELSVEASQRGLQVPNVALRVLHTTRDLFSPRARSYAPRPVIPFLDEEPSQSDIATKQEQVNASTSGENSNKGSAVNVSAEDPTRSKPQSASSNKGTTQKEQEESTAELCKEEPAISGTDLQLEEEEEQFSLEESEVDLRQFSPLGPITIMEYIRLPPQPRVMGQWQMQELEPEVIKQISYPILLAGQDIAEIAPGTKLWPLVSVSMNIPEHLVLGEEPKLARWDQEKCQWRTDGFSEVNLDQENRILTFKSNSFSPIALMQDHYLNMPYQGWTVQPMQLDSTKLSITGNLHQFEILIEKDKCLLVKPDIPELTGLLNKPFLVNRFIQALKSHGLNLAPESDAPNYVAVSNKDSDVENEVYRDLSLLAGHKFNFTWSSWNASCHGDQFILRVCEHQGDALPDVNDWDLVMVGPKCYKLGMRELSEEFSIEKCNGCKTHSSLYHVLLADSPVKWDSPSDIVAHMAHTEAIRNLLLAIRPLIFA